MYSLILDVFVIVALTSCICDISCSITCKDNNNNDVDWFVVYKLPEHTSQDVLVEPGFVQVYMDVHNPVWHMNNVSIGDKGHAIYNTLQQIYDNTKSESTAYLMYNDERPDGVEPIDQQKGHTKGDICFDKTSGFWLVHSVPKFPPPASSSYSYPPTGMKYGQTFLCVSYKYSSFNLIGKQLQYNSPDIYNYSLPPSFVSDNPYVQSAINRSPVKSPPWNNSVKLQSVGGQTFTSFAKYGSYEEDLYDSFVAPYFNSDLDVETWQNGGGGVMPSNCSVKNKVMNVKNVSILGNTFSENSDHSKWAITTQSSVRNVGTRSTSLNVVCIGDINRMDSQKKRGGGTVCFDNQSVWSQFSKSVVDVEPCRHQVGVVGSHPRLHVTKHKSVNPDVQNL